MAGIKSIDCRSHASFRRYLRGYSFKGYEPRAAGDTEFEQCHVRMAQYARAWAAANTAPQAYCGRILAPSFVQNRASAYRFNQRHEYSAHGCLSFTIPA